MKKPVWCPCSDLEYSSQCRCNASMILRRLRAWFRRPPPPLTPTAAPSHLAGDRAEALDLAEFGRLLATGKAEDLKKIAQAMTQKDNVPCVYRKPSPG
jgi:hypothetical protein